MAEDEKNHSEARDHPEREPLKGYSTILAQELLQANREFRRPGGALFLSSLSAGLDLGFGPLLMAIMLSLGGTEFSAPVTSLLLANAYACGFIFVVLGRSELFTEHTTLAMLPVFAGQATVRQLLRTWGLILAGNLLGAFAIAAFATVIGPALGVATLASFAQIAAKVLAHPWRVAFLSAVAAGWLMGLLSWLVTAARDTISQIFAVWLTTFVIGIAGFHHSIAGAIEVVAGHFAGEVSWGECGLFVAVAVAGNAVGGTVFVALLKYSHAHVRA